jgi:outer membrane protein assembly factor BamD
VKQYPDYPHFNDVLHEEFEIARLLKGGERPKYFGVIPGFRSYQSAIEFYKKVIDDAPYSDIAPLALMHIGEFAASKGKSVDAIAAFEKLIDEYPYSEYAPEAYCRLGDVYAGMIKSPLYDQGTTKLAMEAYGDFLTLYPNHDRVPEIRTAYEAMKVRLAESKLATGDFYFNARNNRKAAIIMYRKAEKALPDSDVSRTARERIDHIRAGNLPKKTPVDFLFGRYVRPTEEQLSDDLTVGSKDAETFEFQSDLVRINTDDDNPRRKFVNPDDDGPSGKSFLEIGPSKTF